MVGEEDVGQDRGFPVWLRGSSNETRGISPILFASHLGVLGVLAVKNLVSGYNSDMADVTTTGVFVGTGKPEPVRIEIGMTENEEVVDLPTVTLSVSPVDLTENAGRRVETFLSAKDAAALAQMLLDFAAATEQAIATGEDVDDDYAN